jgi:trans-aconitate methyltransferase
MSQWNPNDYHQHSSQQQKWAREILARLALTGGEQVLDIGCGDGKITAEVARCLPNGLVVGLDSSAEMIEFARQSFSTDRLPQLRFEQGDARRLEFVEQFDWVVSFACLHWVLDHRPVLTGIHRALRRGGRLLLQFGGRGNAAQMVQVMSEVTARPIWADYFVGFTFPWRFHGPEEYLPLLQETGLAVTRLELVPKDMTHEGPQGLEGWLRTTWMPYWQRVPAEFQQQFLDDVVGSYLTTCPVDTKDRLIHLKMARLEVEARKD